MVSLLVKFYCKIENQKTTLSSKTKMTTSEKLLRHKFLLEIQNHNLVRRLSLLKDLKKGDWNVMITKPKKETILKVEVVMMKKIHDEMERRVGILEGLWEGNQS